jgi:hypothetical protein
MSLTKAELISSLQNEIRILVHLCGKVEPAMLDYRPTPKQRSTIELLRYLTVMGPVLVPSIQGGAFLGEQFGAGNAAAAAMDFNAVVKSLASQSGFYAESLGAFSEEQFRGEVELFGMKMSRAQLIANLILCGHAAYRTQLFCYLKACGRDELSTSNLWGGMDAPPPSA